MKLFSSFAALLVLSSAVSYADTPDILNSLSKNSAQVMAKDDAGKTRGEYRVTYVFSPGQPIPVKLNNFSGYSFYTGSNSSNLRKWEFVEKKWEGYPWSGRYVYVAR